MNLPIATASSYFLDLYARYQRDPHSVPADWRVHFEAMDGDGETRGSGEAFARTLVERFRQHGHTAARLDPLGLDHRAAAGPLADARREAAARAHEPAGVALGCGRSPATIGDLAAELERLYAGPVGIEAAQVEDDAARDWLFNQFEASFGAPDSIEPAERAFEAVALADTFETFIKVKFPSKKRFGSEGAESAIVFLRELLRSACLSGFTEAAIGGMHRGRLATLAIVLGKPVGVLLAEIKGRDLTDGGPDFTGDVPYHLGYSGELAHGGKRMAISLSPHPSHLMTVAPVVTGLARAKRSDGDDVLCLLLHTDAAFAGQGLVSEVLQLGGLQGYGVGGTVHLVVNNLIGFTTNASEGRSSRYCTDIGKTVGAPVLHVNGDDPVAVARVAEVALAWRRKYAKDILIDLVCYRRNGHNELDEPRFTQPRVWAAIDARPNLRQSFGDVLRAADSAAFHRVEAKSIALKTAMQQGYEAIATLRPNGGDGRAAAWSAIRRAGESDVLAPVATGLPLSRLRDLGSRASTIPTDVAAHPKVAQFYRARRESYERGADINFASAEALAFATMLADGASVRLSGQDSVRGTFTQRHLAVHDIETGRHVLPLEHVVSGEARFEPVNSPLSEYGVLGFEYGHSLADPQRLTIWEAQFGDFLNGAQIMVDQFIVSAEAKWAMMSGLVALLPHGLEGQGPDHSSARIERLLQLCAGGNIIVANPSTPANLFHLLRRQIVAPWRKPLFVIAPKVLLRLKAAVSSLDDMGPATHFRPLVVDAPQGAPSRFILCAGKVAYELAERRAELGLEDRVAIVRVEQLYPFPLQELEALLGAASNAEWIWMQEEPENQGALGFVRQTLRRSSQLAASCRGAVSRPPLPVAAGGSIERHEAEQRELSDRALDFAHWRMADA